MNSLARTPRVLFYVQHLLGIGHLMRAGRIAEALAQSGMAVTLVSGGLPVKGFKPEGVQQLSLPPIAVGKENFGELVDGDGKVLDDAYRQRRCDMLLQIFRDTEPDCVMLEAFPFGRRQVRFELMPLIEAIESRQPRPLLLSSVRDILQSRKKPGRNEETAQLISQHFDRVLVHGDPNFATLDESFSCADLIADKITYTGLVCAPRPEASSLHFDVLISAGGGAVGDTLVHTSLEAAARLPAELRWCVIAGPNLPEERFSAMASDLPANVLLERFRPDFPSLLCNAGVSVSQAGYNTMGDILQAGCRAILVPYSVGGETEQADRADRLQRLGMAEVLTEEALSGESLAALIRDVLSSEASGSSGSGSRSAPSSDSSSDLRFSLDTQGALHTAQILQALVRESLTIQEP